MLSNIPCITVYCVPNLKGPVLKVSLCYVFHTIQDSEDDTQGRQELHLDPFLDSVQLEFGGLDFPDGRPSRPRPQPIPHPLSTTYRAETINPQPSVPPLESVPEGMGRSADQTRFMLTQPSENYNQENRYDNGHEFTPNFLPPPSYQQVESGSPGTGVTVECVPRDVLEWEERVIPRRSSTSNVQDNPANGLRQRPKSDIY